MNWITQPDQSGACQVTSTSFAGSFTIRQDCYLCRAPILDGRTGPERLEVLSLNAPAKPFKSFPLLSGQIGPHNVVIAAKIDQVVRSARFLQCNHTAKQHVMRAHTSHVSDTAIESDRAVGENRRTGFQRRPHRSRKSFVDRNPTAEQL